MDYKRTQKKIEFNLFLALGFEFSANKYEPIEGAEGGK